MSKLQIVASGEGPSDFGEIIHNMKTGNEEQLYGPLAFIVLSVLEQTGREIEFEIVHKKALCDYATSKRPDRKFKLKKKNDADGAKFHWVMAYMLGRYADEKGKQLAFLHRDTDPRSGTNRGKRHHSLVSSMEQGFSASELGQRGIPVIPNPCLEAWLIHILHDYNGGKKLEAQLGGTLSSENNAKAVLERALGTAPTRENMNNIVMRLELDRMDFPSFTVFKSAVDNAIGCLGAP